MKPFSRFLFTAFFLSVSQTAGAQLFSGNQKISLSFNGNEQFGSLQATQYGDGSWAVIGGLDPKGGNEFLRIMGTVAQFEPNILHFTGTVFLRLNGAPYSPCVVTGDYRLLKAPGKKYWRSSELVTCDDKTRYLNIHF